MYNVGLKPVLDVNSVSSFDIAFREQINAEILQFNINDTIDDLEALNGTFVMNGVSILAQK